MSWNEMLHSMHMYYHISEYMAVLKPFSRLASSFIKSSRAAGACKITLIRKLTKFKLLTVPQMPLSMPGAIICLLKHRELFNVVFYRQRGAGRWKEELMLLPTGLTLQVYDVHYFLFKKYILSRHLSGEFMLPVSKEV